MTSSLSTIAYFTGIFDYLLTSMGQHCLAARKKKLKALNTDNVRMKVRDNLVAQLISKEGLSYLQDAQNRRTFTKVLQTHIEDNG